MRNLASHSLVGLSFLLVLSACSEPQEEKALAVQNDVAIVEGYCTEITVNTLNSVQSTPQEKVLESCQQLKNLLKGRTCENQEQIFPEDEHLEKCEIAFKKAEEKTQKNIAKTSEGERTAPPVEVVTSQPDSLEPAPNPKPIALELKSCSSEITSAVKNLKKSKLKLEKRKSSSVTKIAAKQCKELSSLLHPKGCLSSDSKTGEVKSTTLKSLGLNSFCQKMN